MARTLRINARFRDGRPHFRIDSHGCWLWAGCKNDRGYPQVGVRGRMVYAHRHYYTVHVGPIPSGLQLDHLCRKRSCVNPDHLEAVTQVENIRRGASTKLNCDAVRYIRRAARRGVAQRALAEAFGVHPSHVSRIINRRYWRDLDDGHDATASKV
jgi:hypothetical protein